MADLQMALQRAADAQEAVAAPVAVMKAERAEPVSGAAVLRAYHRSYI
jgi:hypothetical protein